MVITNHFSYISSKQDNNPVNTDFFLNLYLIRI